MLKIISHNVNGLRARLSKYGYSDAVRRMAPDILCLQEVRAKPDQIPTSVLGTDYVGYYSVHDKPGYAGTAIFIRRCLAGPLFDMDGRAVGFEGGRVEILDFKHFKLISSYSPNVGRAAEKLDARGDFESTLHDYVVSNRDFKPFIVCGDLNVAPSAEDTNVKSVAGTTPTERNAFFTLKKDAGLIDVLRNFNPDEQIFTWHSNMYNAKENGKGMRLDHFLVSKELMDKVEDIYVLQDDEFACHSDHLPVVMNINIDL